MITRRKTILLLAAQLSCVTCCASESAWGDDAYTSKVYSPGGPWETLLFGDEAYVTVDVTRNPVPPLVRGDNAILLTNMDAFHEGDEVLNFIDLKQALQEPTSILWKFAALIHQDAPSIPFGRSLIFRLVRELWSNAVWHGNRLKANHPVPLFWYVEHDEAMTTSRFVLGAGDHNLPESGTLDCEELKRNGIGLGVGVGYALSYGFDYEIYQLGKHKVVALSKPIDITPQQAYGAPQKFETLVANATRVQKSADDAAIKQMFSDRCTPNLSARCDDPGI